MIAFDYPLLIYAAPAAAVVLLVLALWARRVRVVRARRWSPDLGHLAQDAGKRAWVVPAIAALFATLALAGPRWGRRTITAESKALNLVIAVDVSRSMLAEDVAPSRLGRAQREARRLIQDLSDDRIGLIAFAGQSFIMSPLTVDGSALLLLVEGLDPDISSVGGTGLSRMLRQGSDLLLGGAEIADRVLVVFTDGEAHDSLPAILAAAEQIRREGVRLILVSEGGREPTTIPVKALDGTLVGQQRDADGTLVQTWRRDAVLTAVADAAQGAVVSAGLRDQAGAVRELVLAYKRSPQATAVTASRVPRGWIPLLIAALILLAHTLTRRTAALVGLALFAAVPVGEAQGLPHPGDGAWLSGEFRKAAEHYVQDVRAGRGGDTAWLNAGTAGLAIGDSALVNAALSRAAESLDPEIRFRALYNLGLAYLRLARRDSANRERFLSESRRRYREALLIKPGDRDAKWNLELAVLQSPPPQGGGSSSNPDPKGGAAQPEERPQPRGGLSSAQAEQILNSIAEEERRTRERQRRRMSQARESGASGVQDW